MDLKMISQVLEMREDGKAITEGMTSEDIWGKFGGVSRTIGVQWEHAGETHKLENPNGLWVWVLPQRDGIAINDADDPSGKYTKLRVLNANGSLRFEVPTVQTIKGNLHAGTFAWYEKPRTSRENAFGVMYVALEDGTMYQLDIDGGTGQVIDVYPAQ
jgi:hypothetical protein